MKEAQPRNADAGKYHLFHGLAIVHDQASLRRLRNLAALGWLGGVLRRSATQWSQGASEPGCKWPSHVDHGSASSESSCGSTRVCPRRLTKGPCAKLALA